MRVPIIAAGLAVAAVSLGALHVSASRSAPGSQYVLHETWHAFSGNPSSPQPTDVYAFQSVLRVPGAAAVGSVDGYATNLRPPMVAWHATAQLQNGNLTFEGVLDQSRRGAGRLPDRRRHRLVRGRARRGHPAARPERRRRRRAPHRPLRPWPRLPRSPGVHRRRRTGGAGAGAPAPARPAPVRPTGAAGGRGAPRAERAGMLEHRKVVLLRAWPGRLDPGPRPARRQLRVPLRRPRPGAGLRPAVRRAGPPRVPATRGARVGRPARRGRRGRALRGRGDRGRAGRARRPGVRQKARRRGAAQSRARWLRVLRRGGGGARLRSRRLLRPRPSRWLTLVAAAPPSTTSAPTSGSARAAGIAGGGWSAPPADRQRVHGERALREACGCGSASGSGSELLERAARPVLRRQRVHPRAAPGAAR